MIRCDYITTENIGEILLDVKKQIECRRKACSNTAIDIRGYSKETLDIIEAMVKQSFDMTVLNTGRNIFIL